jgi:hypothetical protein
MRVSEFWILVEDEFGAAYGRSLAADHHLLVLEDRTAKEALDAGVEPKEIWLARSAAWGGTAAPSAAPEARPSLADGAVDPLAQEVGVAVVAGVLLQHVGQHPAHGLVGPSRVLPHVLE